MWSENENRKARTIWAALYLKISNLHYGATNISGMFMIVMRLQPAKFDTTTWLASFLGLSIKDKNIRRQVLWEFTKQKHDLMITIITYMIMEFRW